MDYDFKALAAPFPEADIEWRIQQSGKKTNGEIWAQVLPYISARAVQDRLDDVIGPMNWQNKFDFIGNDILCAYGIRGENGEWVWKWNGAKKTDIEEFKGGLSSAEKRTAVELGIGRYLYNLENTYATITDKGKNRAKLKDGTLFRWDPPKLPTWALPASR